MTPPMSVLLVGEGNFSFSASVSQLYSKSETSVTATCLQRQEEALRHEGAATNIQIIKDSGGTVLFEVDCTKLGECASLQGRVFDRVVFNFPHCGRKSGVKKNRDLLKSFFISCVQVLAEDGEVHVSLCNGQGGTPVDHPKREWHNSWQVAAMAAEAQLILSDVHPFKSEKYQSYKCTGYRSQDKGFHVEKALVHVFTRSLPYTSAQILTMEEVVEGEKVQYNIPAELSDYIFRGFLCSGSVHPVRLVQDFILKGLSEKWSVSMATETIPLLLTAKQLQASCCDADSAHCYWINLLQKDINSDASVSSDKERDLAVDSQGHTDTQDASSSLCVTSHKADKVRSKGADSLRSTCSIDVDPDEESGLFLLRPSLLPQLEELLTKKEEWIKDTEGHVENEEDNKNIEEEEKEERGGGDNGVTSFLFGVSGLVFKNVHINLWALPAFHELLITGDFPLEIEPVKLLGQSLETLLSPYGVSLMTEKGGLRLTVAPMGMVGRVLESSAKVNKSHTSITVSLNLDLLAVLLFSIPDWRILWSHDPRFLNQFALCPSPGKTFKPFSLFPEHFTFDISFWTGPVWEERRFHAMVREASRGTVEHVKRIDTFSHPDLSQTSYCYRLTYRSHTHALSHNQALQFHQQLESLLSSQLQVTIR
ncbi:ferredoxin-fold anticodon-binding domain-containing protein 1 [Cheilinus undulatus]|uniref:ferredoxin-fold anticodon-binding domain-containing protein 1 n=1 Tax=Cheilinus undulatus TaxID=241271 RepID=UPI001BD58484|nr:ferredoxin-fold anticodon-binding domain-containing protein 1 [Cheilinus undulatus]XP_041656514.1 ferredoxin-fold anticodon-binding domain-containing protein 1 [Cheilinus undulatus]